MLAGRLFQADYGTVLRRTDRLFAGLMLFQWLAAIFAAFVISPRAWHGVSSSTHIHVWAAIVLGGLIASFPAALALWRPGHWFTRHVVAVGQMLTSALLIHLLGGRIETHFHVFGSLAFLAFYRDWRVLISATVIVALDHLLRGLFWPQSVYGVVGGAEWRWLEHAGWVAFEDAFLILSCAQGIREMRGIALRQAQLETANIELAETTRRAEAAAEAKGQFLANMSHEIRTPLNGVIGTTDLLVHTKLDAKQARYAGLIRSSAGTLLSLVNDILDFSKIEAGKFEIESMDFDPRVLVEETAELLSPRASEKGLELLCRISPNIPSWGRGDPGRLRQILLNLGANAVKFTERGEVVISAQPSPTHPGNVRFRVADTGIGIPAERMDLLFKKFSQVDGSNTRRHGGTGLGLAISKELTELMGGQIGVESTPGRGSAFWADIPLGVPTTPGPARKGDVGLAGRRVLVVDDNATNREILTEQCTRWGFEVTVAEDGPAALSLAQSGIDASAFELVLLDMQMPGMTGIDLAHRFRADPRLSMIPLVILSSIDDFGDHSNLSGLFEARLVKPVRQSDLYNTIVRVLAPPRGSAPERDPFPQLTRPTRCRARRLRALLAEDNKVNQIVATDLLSDMGVDCVIAPDGGRALELVRRGGLDLILMDCQMPEMDGFEATKELRRLEAVGPSGPGNPARLPIIALTANALKGDRERCLDAGMDRFITKPVSWEELSKAIDDLVPEQPVADQKPDEPSEETIVYPELLRRCRGKTETVAVVLSLLAEDLAARMVELEHATAVRDATGTARLAHAIKGAAANASAEAVRCRAAAIESEACASHWGMVDAEMVKFRAEVERCTKCAASMAAELKLDSGPKGSDANPRC
jgi:signal transduction histidine kinase/CheY-like chemotaxis protein